MTKLQLDECRRIGREWGNKRYASIPHVELFLISEALILVPFNENKEKAAVTICEAALKELKLLKNK